MLIVNRKSWHFRIGNSWWNNFGFGWGNSNLCKYFWQVVISIIISLFIITVSLLAIGTVIGLIGILIIGWKTTLTVIGFSSFIWLPILAIIGLRMTGINTETKTPEKLNLFSEYLKAKKEKICPIIEFK